MDQLILQTRLENVEKIKQVLQDNPDLNLNEAKFGRKLLAFAMEAKDIEVMKVLLDSGRVDLNNWIVSYEHPLPSKQECFSLKCQRMRKRKSLDLFINPLFFALELESVQKFKLLVERGANLNCRTPKTDRNLLMQACWIGNLDLIKAVVEVGFNYITYYPNWTNKDGLTALDLYCLESPVNLNHFRYGRQKARINKKITFEGFSYLLATAKCTKSSRFPEFVIKFVAEPDFKKLGVPFDEADSDGQTPLMLAAKCKNFNAVKALLDAGASIKKRDREGRSAFLHICKMCCSVEGLKFHTEVLSLCAFDEADVLDFMNNCEEKSIVAFDLIVKKDPRYRELANAHFEKADLKSFFAMFKYGRCSFEESHYQEYLLPIFKKNPGTLIEYIRSKNEKYFMEDLMDGFEEARLDELITELMINRNELLELLVESGNLSLRPFETSTLASWKARLDDDAVKRLLHKCARYCNFDSIQKLRCGMDGLALPCKLTKDDKLMLAFEFNQLDSNNYKAFKGLVGSFSTPNEQGLLPIHVYAEDERVTALDLVMGDEMQTFSDKDLLKLIKILYKKRQTFKSASLESAVKKMQSITTTDDEGNTIVHLLPLKTTKTKKYSKLIVKKFKAAKINLIDFLFDTKNDRGESAYEAQLRLSKHLGMNLVLKAVASRHLSTLQKFLSRLDQLRPGYFKKFIVPKFGPLLLLRAKGPEIISFLISECNIDVNCRVIDFGGHVQTPLQRALIKSRYFSAFSYCVLNRSPEISSIWMYSKHQPLNLRSFWLKRTIKSADEMYWFIMEVFKRKFLPSLTKDILNTIKLSTHQMTKIAFLLVSSPTNNITDELDAVFGQGSVDIHAPMDSYGRSLVDAIVERQKNRNSCVFGHLIKDVEITRILNARKADNSLVLAGSIALGALSNIFPVLPKLLRFGLDSLKKLPEIDVSTVLGSADVCVICHDAFEPTEYLAFLKCRHLFHNDCLFEAVQSNYSAICPCCRIKIG